MARAANDNHIAEALALLERLKSRIGAELHDYPYPIAGCDEVFKTLVAQKEWCRIATTGLISQDGITAADAAEAIAALLATPLDLTPAERHVLEAADMRASSRATTENFTTSNTPHEERPWPKHR